MWVVDVSLFLFWYMCGLWMLVCSLFGIIMWVVDVSLFLVWYMCGLWMLVCSLFGICVGCGC